MGNAVPRAAAAPAQQAYIDKPERGPSVSFLESDFFGLFYQGPLLGESAGYRDRKVLASKITCSIGFPREARCAVCALGRMCHCLHSHCHAVTLSCHTASTVTGCAVTVTLSLCTQWPVAVTHPPCPVTVSLSHCHCAHSHSHTFTVYTVALLLCTFNLYNFAP